MNDDYRFDTDLDAILREFSSEGSAGSEATSLETASRKTVPPETAPPRRPAGSHSSEARPSAGPTTERRTRPEPAAPRQKTKKPAPPPRERKERPVPLYVPEEDERPSGGRRALSSVVTLIFALISALALLWVAVNVHPDSGSAAAASGSRLSMAAKLDEYMNNAASDALGELSFIRKIYKIGENDAVAPKPDESKYGEVSPENAAQVLDVIQRARDLGLLDEQEVVFDAGASFRPDTNIQYYLDETIMVICWKELIDGNTCSCCEIKIADGSQFRRKIADDTYGSSNQYYASTMFNQVNAVVAMNADFYQFRDFGIVAYRRELYRFSESNYTGKYSMYNCVDNCFVTAGGDLLFMHKGETTTADAVRQFMADNDVLFSIAFGPILVEDGVVQHCDWYPAGEPNTGYSRAGIGQVDKLHYFYMSLNHSEEKSARWTVDEFAQHVYEKGVNNAYGLDGGQTSELVFRGAPYNYIDFGAERLVSDIIYFATALPGEEATQ